jgi:propionyl-CoA synthetase
MEEAVSGHPQVAECCVVGVEDDLKGQIPFGLAVLKSGAQISETDLQKEVVGLVREKIGAVASLKNIVVVKRLPKTRSGKILRKLIRTMLDGKDFQIPSTIDDEAIIAELQEKFEEYKIEN